MSIHLDRDRARKYLDEIDLHALFIYELRWDKCSESMDAEVTVSGKTFSLETVAQKRGLVVYQYIADSADAFPDSSTRRKIERKIAKIVHEHLIIYIPNDKSALYWQWVKREPGHPDRVHQHIYCRGQHGEALFQKLQKIAFTLDEEEFLSVVDVSGRVRAAFDLEKVTKKFYECFKKEHLAFIKFIEGIESVTDREWYASLMLNRMMFIYFIQKRGFLDGDENYLRNRLADMQEKRGENRFLTFYRFFLLQLFHKGLGQPEENRDPELIELLGRVPYLNGGLFDPHELELGYSSIDIPDKAFNRIFSFF